MSLLQAHACIKLESKNWNPPDVQKGLIRTVQSFVYILNIVHTNFVKESRGPPFDLSEEVDRFSM